MRSLLVILLCSVAFAAHPKWKNFNNGEDVLVAEQNAYASKLIAEDAGNIQIKISETKEFLKDLKENDDSNELQPEQYLTDRPLVHQPGKIVGGSLVTIQTYPSLVSLQFIDNNGRISQHCGGTILNTWRVLTAAHCKPSVITMSTLRVRAGSSDNQSGGQIRSITRWTDHPLFDRFSADYDVAVVTVNVTFTYTNVIQPVRLASGAAASDNSMVNVAGWGTMREGSGTMERYLRHVRLPVVNRERCRITYPFLTARQVCYGGTQAGQLSSCHGDSGGPAFQNNLQYGIVSHADSCHNGGVPVVFTNVPVLLSWIQQNS